MLEIIPLIHFAGIPISIIALSVCVKFDSSKRFNRTEALLVIFAGSLIWPMPLLRSIKYWQIFKWVL